MAELLLVRHGQASFGAADYDCLSSVGEEQSRRLGRWFRQTGQVPELTASGSLRRQVHTAELCLTEAGVNVPLVAVPGLDEFDHVEVLARHRPDLMAAGALVAELTAATDAHRAFQHLFAAAVERWMGGAFDSDYRCSWKDFRGKVLEGLGELARQDARTIWAFTSAGPIAVVANALVDAPAEKTFELAWPLVNTSVTRVSIGTRRHQLVSYNAWPHLEGAGSAGMITHR